MTTQAECYQNSSSQNLSPHHQGCGEYASGHILLIVKFDTCAKSANQAE